MNIWANCIVNNEENFVWFSIMSVIDYVDKIIIYDTGSTDKTVEIIEDIQRVKKDKIYLERVGKINKDEFPKLRQRMLVESKCDWILILDGDEIWWETSIKKCITEITKQRNNLEGVVVPMIVPVGDIYHIQGNEAGEYKLLGRKGHLSLRFINKTIPGLHVDWPYGKESYFDQYNTLVQERSKLIYLEAPYLHVTHLKRSNQRREDNKFKFELGNQVGKQFKYPEVLYLPYPDVISSPWKRISGIDLFTANFLTTLRKFKRRI